MDRGVRGGDGPEGGAAVDDEKSGFSYLANMHRSLELRATAVDFWPARDERIDGTFAPADALAGYPDGGRKFALLDEIVKSRARDS